MPEIGLQRFALSLQSFDQTPEPERVKIHWLNPSIQVQVKTRLVLWAQYCPATVLGYWGTSDTRVMLRYMPCIELTEQGKLCTEHQALVPAPEPTPSPPPPAPVPKPTLMAHCQDCRDLYAVGFRNEWPGCCPRCAGVRRTAARQAKRTPSKPATWRCRMCRAAIPTTAELRLCQACIDSHLGKDVEDDGVGIGRASELPGQVTSYRNRRGEWVVFGRVQKHSRYAESRGDRFGD